jgi:hypothetical protein
VQCADDLVVYMLATACTYDLLGSISAVLSSQDTLLITAVPDTYSF